MHFEILVEDLSGKKFLEFVLPKIVGVGHTFRVIAYRGVGRLPRNLQGASDPRKRILLDRIPRLIRGYGRTFEGYGSGFAGAVFIVCDLDDRCFKTFRSEIMRTINRVEPRPLTHLCFAIEEGEAWLLGDGEAVKRAYPRAKDAILDSYSQDSICGTWEKLADAVYPGGSTSLKKSGWQAVGMEKGRWAEAVGREMDAVEDNKSPSFRYFRGKLKTCLRANDD